MRCHCRSDEERRKGGHDYEEFENRLVSHL
jgi:hypothetical protein